jgi:hypothetical protein
LPLFDLGFLDEWVVVASSRRAVLNPKQIVGGSLVVRSGISGAGK